MLVPRGDGLLDAVVIAHVERDPEGTAAERFDFLLKLGKRGRVAAGDDQVRTGTGERAAHVLAESAAGAGDEGDFAGKIKGRFSHGRSFHSLRG